MKVLFKFYVDHTIDLITNSSSELFILEAQSREIVEQMIIGAHPDYRDEYEPVVRLIEATDQEVETYMSWTKEVYYVDKDVAIANVLPGFKFEDQYELMEKTSWSKGDQYRMKGDFIGNNIDKVRKALDPEGKIWLLFSTDENPKWDFQDRLQEIGERIHMG